MNARSLVFFAVKSLIWISLACGIPAHVVAQPVEALSPGALALEQAFLSANNLIILHSQAELPANEYKLIVGDEHHFADLGDDYLTGDVVTGGIPVAQHLFTAISDELIAFMYIAPYRFGTKLFLILKNRGEATGCLYTWNDWSLGALRLSAVRQALEGKRPETVLWNSPGPIRSGQQC